MNKLFLLLIFFLSSCSINTDKMNFNFSEEMNFEEFKIKLNEYAINKPYPNIDK